MSDKKTAIYIRVSTDAQREEGYSIDAQTEMLQAACVSKGIKDYELYIDGGFTGSNIERPALQRLITDVKNKKIATVMVYKLDRLSRSQKDTLYLIEDVFNPYGVDFISLQEYMDTSTPIGRLMLGILSAFAQLERENIRERTRMGMLERIKLGYWPGGGRIPFGYDYDQTQGILVPNKDAESVRRMYDLYLKGYAPARIAQILGLKYDRLVVQILMRKSNCGFICYNGKEYQGRHKPIVDLETYEKAMDAMRQRSVNRINESEHLLSGLMECGYCHAKMRYQKWGKYCKIVCYSSDKGKPYLIKDPDCKNKVMACDVEEIVIKDLFEFSLGGKKCKSQEDEQESVLHILQKQYDDISKKLKKLYNLYAESEDDLLLETINDTRKKLSGLQTQLEREYENNNIRDKITAISKTLSTLRETWEFMTSTEKKLVIRSCIEKVVITSNKVEIFYKFKTMDMDKLVEDQKQSVGA